MPTISSSESSPSQLHLKMTCKLYYDHPSLIVHVSQYQEVYPHPSVANILSILSRTYIHKDET